MAPSGRKRRRVTTRSISKRTRQKVQPKKLLKTAASPCNTSIMKPVDDPSEAESSKPDGNDHIMTNSISDISSIGFSTPKAQKFKIPEIHTCPHAPMKKRPVNFRSRPLAFFAPPDIDLFFLRAHLDISV